MIRFLLIAVVIGALLYLFKGFFFNSDYKKCGKCEGKGYWIALRGEKNKCDACQGSGKIIR
jgi:DnaJ-class molecular chaperone